MSAVLNDEKLQATRTRFMRDDVPVRLGNLASNLARISSFAERESRVATVTHLLRETQWFVEWTGPDANPDLQPRLLSLQRELARWRLNWPDSAPDLASTVTMSARRYADEILQRSGLLDA